MITSCAECGRKTRQIDASIYAGDYQSDDPQLYATARQCVQCGTVYEVRKFRKQVRVIERISCRFLPPQSKWEEPRL